MVPDALLPLLASLVLFQQPAPPALEPNGDSTSPSISDDGNFIVFESRASNFVAGDQKGTWDIFLYERASGAIARISDSEPLAARSPQISGDGRWIVFLQAQPAEATPLGTWQDTEHPWRVGRYDRKLGATHWIGDARPTFELVQAPAMPSISRDGGRLVFPTMVDGLRVIQLYDAASQQLTLLNPANVYIDEAEISRSGRFVAFSSTATTLATLPPMPEGSITFNFDDERHIYRRDLENGRTEYASHLGIEAIGYGDFCRPKVSDDGRFVAYDHHDERWMGSPNVGFISDLHERKPGRLLPVPKGDTGLQGMLDVSWLSSDGQRAILSSGCNELPVVRKACRYDQVVLRDLKTQSWCLVSQAADGAPGNSASSAGVASDDVSVIAFASTATNLVVGDSNGMNDIFLFERSSGKTTRIVPQSRVAPESVDTKALRSQPDGDSGGAQISEDGEYVVFASRASNFDAQDFGSSWDVFLLTCASRAVRRLSVAPHAMVSYPVISGDGHWIAYWLRSDAYVARASDANWILQLVDRASGVTKSVEGLRPWRYGYIEPGPSISRDGSRLAFLAWDPAWDPGSIHMSVKLYDVKTDARSLVGWADGAVWPFALSGDGQSVAFGSQSILSTPWPSVRGHALAPLLRGYNLYVRDLELQATRVASGLLPGIGLSGDCIGCIEPLLSQDGNRVAFNYSDEERFSTPSSQLGFVTDLAAGDAENLLTLVEDPRTFRGSMRITWLAPEGDVVLVSRKDEALLDPAAGRFPQVFAHTLGSAEWIPISRSATGAFANRPAENARASRDLSRIVFDSEADNLVPGDTNNARDLFIVDRSTSKITRVGPR